MIKRGKVKLDSSSSNRKLRIGIIGAGSFAERHMEEFAKLGDVEVVAFMRRSESALAEMQKKWGVDKGFTDHHAMLDDSDIDAIDIVTPTDSHKMYALDAISSGRHVLCEKPLALTASDCRVMLDAAESTGVIHAVNFNQRGRTSVGRLKRYLDDGYVGDVYHTSIWWGMTQQHDARPEALSWRFRPETGGGTVYELIHVFDMALLLNGEAARIVSMLSIAERQRAFADVPEGMDNISVPDSSAFLIEHVNGSYTVAHTSFVSRGTSALNAPRVDVAGSRGRIMTNGLHGLLGNSGENGMIDELTPGPPYPQPYEQFVSAALSGDQSLVDTGFDVGLAAAKIVDAAYASWESREWVDIDR